MLKKNNIKESIEKIIGEIAASGIREEMKSLSMKDSVYIKLNNFIKKYVAHSRENYSKLGLEELKTRLKEFSSVYENDFKKIKERINKKNKM